MRLPVIKAVVEFIEEYDEDYVDETITTLEAISQARGIREEELELIGELVSNLCGAVEVSREIKKGTDKKQALNEFMKRVLSTVN